MNLESLLLKIDNYLLRVMPGRLIRDLRQTVLRRLGASIAESVYIGQGVRIMGPARLILEAGVVIARDSVLDARGGLTLQSSALIGFESILLTHTHRSPIVGVPIQDQGMYEKPIVIGRRAWLGTRVIVLPGAVLGNDVIIGSGSVVTKNLAPEAIYAGSPARLIRQRTSLESPVADR